MCCRLLLKSMVFSLHSLSVIYLQQLFQFCLFWKRKTGYEYNGNAVAFKNFDYNQMVVCGHCGSYGRYQVYMTYMCLSLFFIPCLKWNRQYYVQSTCCNTVYSLAPEIGKQIARGENIEILPEHLIQVQAGYFKCQPWPLCRHGCQYDRREENCDYYKYGSYRLGDV